MGEIKEKREKKKKKEKKHFFVSFECAQLCALRISEIQQLIINSNTWGKSIFYARYCRYEGMNDGMHACAYKDILVVP